MKIILAALLFSLLASCTKQGDYREVPVASCHSQFTGETKEEQITAFNCYSYDKNGVCTFSVPTTTYLTRKQINTLCQFKEWQ